MESKQYMTYTIEKRKHLKPIFLVDAHLADGGVVQAVGTGYIFMSTET